MSIATQGGDKGQTSLIGGRRVSKGDRRVEAYGTVDELIAQMGFARSICDHEEVRTLTRDLQRELFAVCEAVATPFDAGQPPAIDPQRIEALTAHVHRFEALPGILLDWAVPGDHAAGAAYDVARTVCRKAERAAVRLRDSGEEIDPNVVVYLNRLSDLLWLMGRVVEKNAGVDSSLRDEAHRGPRWSKAW